MSRLEQKNTVWKFHGIKNAARSRLATELISIGTKQNKLLSEFFLLLNALHNSSKGYIWLVGILQSNAIWIQYLWTRISSIPLYLTHLKSIKIDFLINCCKMILKLRAINHNKYTHLNMSLNKAWFQYKNTPFSFLYWELLRWLSNSSSCQNFAKLLLYNFHYHCSQKYFWFWFCKPPLRKKIFLLKSPLVKRFFHS